MLDGVVVNTLLQETPLQYDSVYGNTTPLDEYFLIKRLLTWKWVGFTSYHVRDVLLVDCCLIDLLDI